MSHSSQPVLPAHGRHAAEVTGLAVSDPRHAYTYRVALTLGRLWTRETGTTGTAAEPGPGESL